MKHPETPETVETLKHLKREPFAGTTGTRWYKLVRWYEAERPGTLIRLSQNAKRCEQ